MDPVLFAAPAAGVLALIFAYWKAGWVTKQDPGEGEMIEIADEIAIGAMAFLGREYRVIAMFVAGVAALLAAANMSGEARSPLIAVAFVGGAAASALAGFIGMRVATKANVRTTAAARHGIAQALQVAFSGGSVMGMSVVGLALLGLGGFYVAFTQVIFKDSLLTALNVLTGFSMGARRRPPQPSCHRRQRR